MEKITAHKIAKYIISELQDAGEAVSNIKLQKLLYYVQGWHMGLYDKQVFEDEFQAWRNGPVIYDVFKEYEAFGAYNPITKLTHRPNVSEALEKHIYEVLECYGGESAFSLVALTHREWPWIEARGDLPLHASSQNIISKNTMKDFFAAKAKENEETGNYIPNLETVRAIEDSRRGIGTTTVNSWKEMIDEVYDELKAEGFEIPNYDRV
jgi:uncharacterized phage-associated protein